MRRVFSRALCLHYREYYSPSLARRGREADKAKAAGAADACAVAFYALNLRKYI